MLAFFIFLSTLILLFWRPWNLPIWVFSSLGAFFVFIFQLVDFTDAYFVFSLVWDSSLTLVGLIILSFSLEALGFFDFIASKILHFSREKNQEKIYISTKKLMLFLLIFVFFLSAFFANDGAILIITPIIIALFSTLKDCKNHVFILSSFLLSLSFLCDASSNALVISNLTNIITANYFKIEFLEFAKNMFLPNFFVLLSTIVMVFMLYGRVLPKRLEFKLVKKEQISLKLFFLCIVFLLLFVISFFIGEIFDIKISFFALLWAGIFWLIVLKIQGKKSIKILFEAPYGVLLFSFGLYMVVFALHKIGVSEILVKSYAFLMQDKSGIFGVTLISAFGSSVFNNLPMVLIGDLALKEYFENFSFDSLMIYAHLLGVNIGPKLTPIGSLATLLWLGVLARKGINISFWQYSKFGFLITLPVLVFSLFALIV